MEMSVKAGLLGISLLVGLGSLSVAVQASPAAVANDAVQIDASLAVPPGVVLREIFRIHRPSTNTHVTNFYWPDNWEDIGYVMEGTLGFISATSFENSVLIRNCVGPQSWNSFTSSDPNCEPAAGGVVLPGNWNIGYISTVQLPGTIPLYRCSFIWQKKVRHFDTHDANCESVVGANNDGPVGYVFL